MPQATNACNPPVCLTKIIYMKRHFFPSLLLLAMLISGTVNIISCNKGGPGKYDTGNNSTKVSIQNFSFSVASLSIASGATVTWTNNDATAHTVTADDGTFNSGNIAPGQTFSRTFTSTGTFAYHCSIHPMMKAAVVVK